MSTKDEPDDIDCVYLIDVERAQVHPGSQAEKLLSVVSNNQTRDVLRLRIDSFVIPWRPFHGQPSPEAAAYLKQRGYWDDFWGRTRAADDSPQELRLSSTPRRGYLEVMIDGY
ncbi:hypothetical protein AVL60_01190 [Kocuria palustris]|nr:hypothetical protein [Kocuria palustris]KUG54981.1 hypothetical protein AVL60_01190 [Kocuria palustris]